MLYATFLPTPGSWVNSFALAVFKLMMSSAIGLLDDTGPVCFTGRVGDHVSQTHEQTWATACNGGNPRTSSFGRLRTSTPGMGLPLPKSRLGNILAAVAGVIVLLLVMGIVVLHHFWPFTEAA